MNRPILDSHIFSLTFALIVGLFYAFRFLNNGKFSQGLVAIIVAAGFFIYAIFFSLSAIAGHLFIPPFFIIIILLYRKIYGDPAIEFWYYSLTIVIFWMLSRLGMLSAISGLDTALFFIPWVTAIVYCNIVYRYVKAIRRRTNILDGKIYVKTNIMTLSCTFILFFIEIIRIHFESQGKFAQVVSKDFGIQSMYILLFIIPVIVFELILTNITTYVSIRILKGIGSNSI